MLALRQENKIISKIVTMADGRVALVHFLVCFENGVLKARIISVRYEDAIETENNTLSLCGDCKDTGEIVSTKKFYKSIVSPFASLDFFVSQPTRAPSFVF
jgi:hypothetical protein